MRHKFSVSTDTGLRKRKEGKNSFCPCQCPVILLVQGFDNILHLFKEMTHVKPWTYLSMVQARTSQGVIQPWSHPEGPVQ